jgi:hypothetical protein
MFNLPKFNVGSKGREIGTYVAGGLVRAVPLYSLCLDCYIHQRSASAYGLDGSLVCSVVLSSHRCSYHFLSRETAARCAL